MESACCTKMTNIHETIFKLNYKSLDDDYLQSFLIRKKEELKLTFDIVVYVEEATRNQSTCNSWYKVRVGQINASTLHQVFHARVETPPVSFIVCKVIKSPAIKWGRQNSSTINSVKEENSLKKKQKKLLKVPNDNSTKSDLKNNFYFVSLFFY